MPEKFKLITSDQMTLEVYPCGVRAGDILRLREDLHVRDHKNRPTGTVHPAGQMNVVFFGNPDEPEVIWLQRPDGQRHTWDDDTIFETFELTGLSDPRFSP